MMIRMTLFLNSEDTFGGADVADEPTTPVDDQQNDDNAKDSTDDDTNQE